MRSQLQAELRTERIDRGLPLMQALTPGGHLGTDPADRLTIGPVRQQQARFLEAFAQRRHVVVQPTFGEPHAGAGCGIIQPHTVRVTITVLRIEQAAGKHPGAAGLVAALGATKHQHFDALLAITHDDDRGSSAQGARNRRSV